MSYNKFIDKEFSYNGKLNFGSEEFKKTDNIFKTEMSLEPRLKEYISKRKYYKKNNIVDIVSLRKTYQINDTDIDTLKKYLKKKKMDRDNKFLDKNKKFVDYKKISEHSFQYVNPKIVNPVLGVEVWNRGGVSSRLDNKKSSRKTRENRELF